MIMIYDYDTTTLIMRRHEKGEEGRPLIGGPKTRRRQAQETAPQRFRVIR
jgi:hypothetical protein